MSEVTIPPPAPSTFAVPPVNLPTRDLPTIQAELDRIEIRIRRLKADLFSKKKNEGTS